MRNSRAAAADAEGRDWSGAEAEPQRARGEYASGGTGRHARAAAGFPAAARQRGRVSQPPEYRFGALGISFPQVPTVVGPFAHYDFRLSASQSLIDRHSYHNWKASEKQEEAAKLDYQDARDLVIRQAAGLYLDSQASAAEVEAAESSRDHFPNPGETGARPTRPGTGNRRGRGSRPGATWRGTSRTLLVARNAYQTSLLALAHFLGLSPGAPLELAEPLKFHHVESADADQALHTALEARSDYAALLKQRDSLAEQLKASRARYLPTLSVNGDYGAIGRGFGSMAGTGEIQGTLTVTLFDRDRAGEKTELQSQVKRLNAQIDDLNREIEQELRTALLDLESTENQVTVTEAALHLAERELSLAQDRFRNGVTDNIEVVTAQASLASAQDDRITGPGAARRRRHGAGALAGRNRKDLPNVPRRALSGGKAVGSRNRRYMDRQSGKSSVALTQEFDEEVNEP